MENDDYSREARAFSELLSRLNIQTDEAAETFDVTAEQIENWKSGKEPIPKAALLKALEIENELYRLHRLELERRDSIQQIVDRLKSNPLTDPERKIIEPRRHMRHKKS